MIPTTEFACLNCQTIIQRPTLLRAVQWIVCPQCGHQHFREQGRENWSVRPGSKPNNDVWAILPGATGLLDGKNIMVTGAVELRESDTMLWHEYPAIADDGTRYFLNETDGNWVLLTDHDLVGAGRFDYIHKYSPLYDSERGANFKLIYDYESNVNKCIGVFDYDVMRTALCEEFIAPPEMLVREDRSGEVSFFLGRYLPQDELQSAFGEQILLVEGRGVPVLEPFPINPVNFNRILGGFALFFVVMMLVDWVRDRNQEVLRQEIATTDSLASQVLVSEPFDLQGSTSYLTFKMVCNDLDNQWIAEEITLINDVTQVERTISVEASFYRGYDSDGSWTEDKTHTDAILCSVAPGRYHLEVTTHQELAQVGPHLVQLRVYWQQTHFDNLMMALIILLVSAIIFHMIFYINESERWKFSDYSKYKTDE
jgi:DNA-directed RNA polymerase subunit RPC12/RpoP